MAEGIIPGLGGVVIFIPQIAILFLFISILEETGYMSRVVFLMDRIMRRFGLSGKSIVPLISGTACAIPAVMATRNIENWKQRLITILVVPFTTCSARLPVYLIIISLIIPNERVFWIFGYQSLTLMFLYLIGFGAALLSAALLNKFLKMPTKSFFVVEMPNCCFGAEGKRVCVNVLQVATHLRLPVSCVSFLVITKAEAFFLAAFRAARKRLQSHLQATASVRVAGDGLVDVDGGARTDDDGAGGRVREKRKGCAVVGDATKQ